MVLGVNIIYPSAEDGDSGAAGDEATFVANTIDAVSEPGYNYYAFFG